ncbi:hypothetical protein FHL15_007229 [Xylaria flabelliformis]|uniref:ATPase AAA-type core domain-containing protein n=1 Tax=Xylaria flabelliformis TaxID=2512241 RepID=A0A553HVB6_9PEZI|nr:hypothetical protein FHL15_007229 [Xylaria flabelliformis]
MHDANSAADVAVQQRTGYASQVPWNSQDKDKDWDFKVDFILRGTPDANRAEVRMVSIKDLITDKILLTKEVRDLTDDPSQIPKEDLILLPHRLPAFVLKDCKWAKSLSTVSFWFNDGLTDYLAVVDIKHVKKVEQFDGWPSLVLPRGYKNMIHSLIQAHYHIQTRPDTNKNIRADVVCRKGKGLIILLCGAPGVGKTSTAECVTGFYKQPLYHTTCGDLGIASEEVETRIKCIFIQAQEWKYIFLVATGNNVKHKNLVSDEAFKSRVHMTLYYPALHENSTLEIFKHNLQRTKLCKRNSRQIQNAFHIAIALAEDEAQERGDTAMKINGQEPKQFFVPDTSIWWKG